MISQRLKFIAPFFILFLLLALFWYELFYSHKNTLPSALVGQNIPAFSLPTLTPPQQFVPDEVKGRVVLINVFASWCNACHVEADMLMKINQEYHIPIYGIAYKDKAEDVRNWLRKYGNPFVQIGLDATGNTAIDFGVYGTPETFVINQQGKIVYRHVGAIDQAAWDNVLYPLIQRYQQSDVI